MATPSMLSQAELLSKLAAVATANSGTALTATDGTITGTLTAIKAKWLLGGRKVTSKFRYTLEPSNHESHFRESAVESSWGLPPPTFTVETTSQFGCEQCTDECTKCGDKPCCKACAEACRKCHDACRAMRR